MAQKNTNPLLIVVANRPDDIQSMKITCEKKVVTGDISIGNRLISGVIILLAVYFAYQLEFPQDIKLGLLFLQEKLLHITVEEKVPLQYSNFFCATSCISSSIEQDEDLTQDPWNLDSSWC